jgi:hypothetical protein
MRPLETEHEGWRIRITSRAVGRRWSALVETWPPDKPTDVETAQVVPFNLTADSERSALETGRQAAVKFIDRQVRPAQ